MSPLSDEQNTDWQRGQWLSPIYVLMLAVAATLMGMLLGGALIAAWENMTGTDNQAILRTITENNTPAARHWLRSTNLLAHLLTFTVAALATAWWAFRHDWASNLGLSRRPSLGKLAAALSFILLTMPWVQLTYWLNKHLPLPQPLADMEAQTGEMIKALLVMEHPVELWYMLLVIALAPAVGEELLFRGIVQTQIQRLQRSPHLAVWATALLFSAIHFQFAGFLPRMLLGAVLGYLFLWTGSLWTSIAAHFTVNASQVLAQYFIGADLESVEEKLNFITLAWPCLLVLPVLWWLGAVLRKPEVERVAP